MFRELFESFNLQVVSSTSWGAQRVEEMIYQSDVRAVFSAGNGEVEVYEISIPGYCSGRNISDLMGNCQGVVVAMTRAGKARLPDMDMVLEASDVLHVSATFEGIEMLRSRLCGKDEEV
jgi:trk system potassium uptake protein TrkA